VFDILKAIFIHPNTIDKICFSMIHIRITTSILLLLLALDVFAQDDSPNELTLYLEFGVSNASLKDQVFSDLKFNGIVFQSSLGFEKTTNLSFWSVGLSGKLGTIKYDNIFPTLYLDFDLSFKFAKTIDHSARNSLYAGGVFASKLNILDYDGYENGSWMSGHSLGLLLRKNIIL